MKLTFTLAKAATPVLPTLFLAIASAIPGAATVVTNPPNEFLPSFTGPLNGDLEVLSANVTLDGSNFDFTATLNGTVGETPGAVYVFGINRGDGASKFANIGEAGVVFDATFVISAAGTGTVNDLLSKTATPVAGVTPSASAISAVVPVSDLPSEGFSPGNYQFNLWPEAGPPNPGNTEISNFTPNNSDAQVSVVPEPGTVSLCGMAAGGALVLLRRRNAARK
jgi:hypothetical protein